VANEVSTRSALVLADGYPGRTFRYRTAAEVTSMQEYSFPTFVRYATDLSNILHEMGKTDRNVEIAKASRIKGMENTLKNYTGSLTGFDKFPIVAQREQRENHAELCICD